jgi:hypothetical protein
MRWRAICDFQEESANSPEDSCNPISTLNCHPKYLLHSLNYGWIWSVYYELVLVWWKQIRFQEKGNRREVWLDRAFLDRFQHWWIFQPENVKEPQAAVMPRMMSSSARTHATTRLFGEAFLVRRKRLGRDVMAHGEADQWRQLLSRQIGGENAQSLFAPTLFHLFEGDVGRQISQVSLWVMHKSEAHDDSFSRFSFWGKRQETKDRTTRLHGMEQAPNINHRTAVDKLLYSSDG